MNIGACIFDMDGLLIDSEKIALKVYLKTCEHYGQEHLNDLYKQLLGTNGVTTRRILQEKLPDTIDVNEFVEHWFSDYSAETEKGIPLMRGVENLLDYLEASNIPKIVATSTETPRAQKKLEQSGILDRFETIIGGDQISNGKPAPDIYLKAADFLKIPAKECLAIEDSPNGVIAAVLAGMHVVQIPDLVKPDSELLALGHRVLESLDDIVVLLQSLEN